MKPVAGLRLVYSDGGKVESLQMKGQLYYTKTVDGKRRRRHAPYYRCHHCFKRMKNRTGACKRCIGVIVTAAAVMKEQRRNGDTHDVLFDRCPLAQWYGDHGRMYGTPPKHISLAGKELRR